MKYFTNELNLISKSGYQIAPIKLEGPEQMALDIFLLEEAIDKKDVSLILRFYRWEGSWLSLGYNQKNIPKDWELLANKGKLKIVRRPSGGGAVLHSGGITYSLIWPNAPRKKHEAYFQASQWIIEGFKEFGLFLTFGKESPRHISQNCFSNSTIADLIDQGGNKRVGSAQHWKKGYLLQHGEILLNPPHSLWEEVFKEKAPGNVLNSIKNNEIEFALKNFFEKYFLRFNLKERFLDPKELEKIKQNSSQYNYNFN